MMHITEDTPPDMLAGAMDLTVHLPNGRSVKMSVERCTPMMDVLMQITTAHQLQLSGYVIEALGMAPSSEYSDKILPYKPNTPIGTLDTQHIRVVQKPRTLPVPKNIPPGHQPFESTFRLKVHLPRKQLFVSRVSMNVLLENIMKKVCDEKLLDPNKYEFRHPDNQNEVLDPKLTLEDYKITEIYLVSKGSSRLSQAFSASDIMALRKDDERKQSKSSSGGVFNLIFKRGKMSNGSGSVSSDNRSISPTHSDDSRSVTPPAIQQQIIKTTAEKPKAPQRKRRPAPKPPQPKEEPKPVEIPATETPKKNENGLTICHSRNSSDSSGYHEASILSDNANTSLPRRPQTMIMTEEMGRNKLNGEHSKSTSNLSTMSLQSKSTSSLAFAGRKKKAPPPPPVVKSANSVNNLEKASPVVASPVEQRDLLTAQPKTKTNYFPVPAPRKLKPIEDENTLHTQNSEENQTQNVKPRIAQYKSASFDHIETKHTVPYLPRQNLSLDQNEEYSESSKSYFDSTTKEDTSDLFSTKYIDSTSKVDTSENLESSEIKPKPAQNYFMLLQKNIHDELKKIKQQKSQLKPVLRNWRSEENVHNFSSDEITTNKERGLLNYNKSDKLTKQQSFHDTSSGSNAQTLQGNGVFPDEIKKQNIFVDREEYGQEVNDQKPKDNLEELKKFSLEKSKLMQLIENKMIEPGHILETPREEDSSEDLNRSSDEKLELKSSIEGLKKSSHESKVLQTSIEDLDEFSCDKVELKSSIEDLKAYSHEKLVLKASIKDLEEVSLNEPVLKSSTEDLRRFSHETLVIKSSIENLEEASHKKAELKSLIEDVSKFSHEKLVLKLSVQDLEEAIHEKPELKSSIEDLEEIPYEKPELKSSIENLTTFSHEKLVLKSSIEDLEKASYETLELQSSIEDLSKFAHKKLLLKSSIDDLKEASREEPERKSSIEDLTKFSREKLELNSSFEADELSVLTKDKYSEEKKPRHSEEEWIVKSDSDHFQEEDFPVHQSSITKNQEFVDTSEDEDKYCEENQANDLNVNSADSGDKSKYKNIKTNSSYVEHCNTEVIRASDLINRYNNPNTMVKLNLKSLKENDTLKNQDGESNIKINQNTSINDSSKSDNRNQFLESISETKSKETSNKGVWPNMRQMNTILEIKNKPLIRDTNQYLRQESASSSFKDDKDFLNVRKQELSNIEPSPKEDSSVNKLWRNTILEIKNKKLNHNINDNKPITKEDEILLRTRGENEASNEPVSEKTSLSHEERILKSKDDNVLEINKSPIVDYSTHPSKLSNAEKDAILNLKDQSMKHQRDIKYKRMSSFIYDFEEFDEPWSPGLDNPIVFTSLTAEAREDGEDIKDDLMSQRKIEDVLKMKDDLTSQNVVGDEKDNLANATKEDVFRIKDNLTIQKVVGDEKNYIANATKYNVMGYSQSHVSKTKNLEDKSKTSYMQAIESIDVDLFNPKYKKTPMPLFPKTNDLEKLTKEFDTFTRINDLEKPTNDFDTFTRKCGYDIGKSMLNLEQEENKQNEEIINEPKYLERGESSTSNATSFNTFTRKRGFGIGKALLKLEKSYDQKLSNHNAYDTFTRKRGFGIGKALLDFNNTESEPSNVSANNFRSSSYGDDEMSDVNVEMFAVSDAPVKTYSASAMDELLGIHSFKPGDIFKKRHSAAGLRDAGNIPGFSSIKKWSNNEELDGDDGTGSLWVVGDSDSEPVIPKLPEKQLIAGQQFTTNSPPESIASSLATTLSSNIETDINLSKESSEIVENEPPEKITPKSQETAPPENTFVPIQNAETEEAETEWQYRLPSPPTAFRDSSPTLVENLTNYESTEQFKTDSVVTSPELFEKLKQVKETQSEISEDEKLVFNNKLSLENLEKRKSLVYNRELATSLKYKDEDTSTQKTESISSKRSSVLSELEEMISNSKTNTLNKNAKPTDNFIHSDSNLPNFKITTYDMPKNKINIFEDDSIRSNENTCKNISNLLKSQSGYIGRSMENLSGGFKKPEYNSSNINRYKSKTLARTNAEAVGRSESFSAGNWVPANPVKRSKSQVAINQYKEDMNETGGDGALSKANSLFDVSGLQSLEVMRKIQTKLKTPSTSTDELDRVEPPPPAPTKPPQKEPPQETPKPQPQHNDHRYGPPSINLGTWSERPKSQITLKEDTDYKFNVSNTKFIASTNNKSQQQQIVNLRVNGIQQNPIRLNGVEMMNQQAVRLSQSQSNGSVIQSVRLNEKESVKYNEHDSSRSSQSMDQTGKFNGHDSYRSSESINQTMKFNGHDSSGSNQSVKFNGHDSSRFSESMNRTVKFNGHDFSRSSESMKFNGNDSCKPNESNNQSVRLNGGESINQQPAGNVIIKIGGSEAKKDEFTSRFINHTTAVGFRKPLGNINTFEKQRPHSVAFDSTFDISRVPRVHSVELKKPFKDFNKSITQICPQDEIESKSLNYSVNNNGKGNQLLRINSFSQNTQAQNDFSTNKNVPFAQVKLRRTDSNKNSQVVNNNNNNIFGKVVLRNTANRFSSGNTLEKPPPPPVMPKISTPAVQASKNVSNKPQQNQSEDPRDELLSAIRNFGGKKGLKSVNV